MDTNLRQIFGNWDFGYALHKHTVSSTPAGVNEYGHTVWNTVRTEPGEALFQLKYRGDWNQVGPIAQAIVRDVCPKLSKIGFVVPMPASKARARQPVYEIARAVGAAIDKPVFEDILRKTPTGKALKDIGTKEDRAAALAGAITLNDEIDTRGRWNVLLVDDRYDTGASLEAASAVLRTYPKVGSIYVATVTW
ncbi:ComF family protein [Cupriavidus pauculus]|uniref:ComF family protein n=1 Tax=Cupriavidus pauculus TaxID=82633 RepID=UPI001D0C794D|nr:ComF family protein [Cupriavidus pauculus]